MKSITKSLLESLDNSSQNAEGLTIAQYAKLVCGGEMDCDVCDKDIDMLVCMCYNTNGENSGYDEMDKFLDIIANNVKIVKQHPSSYGDVLECDFSSFFKPYNEQLKDYFNMEYSEFDEDEAYYEAVVNLEPLLSGNASESQYKELNDILKSNTQEITNEADNMESTIDEAARYLFDEGDKDYLPDYEEFNDTTMEISKDLFDKAKERALEALTNLAEHQYYDHDGGYGTVLELNDNHTMWELTNENKSDEEWASIVQSKLAQFKADTGVELMLLGRMGRHACVEPTYDNCMNFTYLQETQEKLEQEAIDEFNTEEMNESLSPNSGRKYVSKNVYVMNYKGTYIVLYHGHNEKEFDNETDAFSYAKKLAKEKNEELKESTNIDINNLTKEQLWKLRQEIVLGSLYTHDYDNSFGIDPSAVCNFFDSFIEDAQMDDYGKPNNRKTEEYDNAEDLYNYYCSCENPFGEVEDINESEDVKRDLAIEPGSDEEATLDSLYDRKIKNYICSYCHKSIKNINDFDKKFYKDYGTEYVCPYCGEPYSFEDLKSIAKYEEVQDESK